MHTKYIEQKVRELKAQGVTDFYKIRADLSDDCARYCIYSEDTPKLDWDVFEGEHYSPSYMWLLFYFDGKEYSEALIAPDNVSPENIEYWFHIKDSSIEEVRKSKESSYEYFLEQYNRDEEYYRSLVEKAIETYTDFESHPLGEKPKIYEVSSRLSRIHTQIVYGDVPISDLIWWMVHEAYLAGKDAEYLDSQYSRELASKGKALLDQQKSRSKKKSQKWIAYVESLLKSDPSMSAQAVAESLKSKGLCNYSDWGQDIEFSDNKTKTKTLNAFRKSVSGIKTRLTN